MSTKKPEAGGGEPAFKPEPDAWARFEKAVDKVVKTPPQHRAVRKRKDKEPPPACAPRSPSPSDETA